MAKREREVANLPGADGFEPVATGEGDGRVTGMDTEGLETDVRPEGRPIRKVGFIVNDTIENANAHSERIGRLLTGRRVQVLESHSASPDTPVRWTRDDNLDLIFTFGGDGTILRAARIAGPLGVP